MTFGEEFMKKLLEMVTEHSRIPFKGYFSENEKDPYNKQLQEKDYKETIKNRDKLYWDLVKMIDEKGEK